MMIAPNSGLSKQRGPFWNHEIESFRFWLQESERLLLLLSLLRCVPCCIADCKLQLPPPPHTHMGGGILIIVLRILFRQGITVGLAHDLVAGTIRKAIW